MKLQMAVSVVLLAAVTGLAACGGSAPAAPPAASAIASQLGATGVRAVKPPTLYAYDEVTATLRGRPVDIATFRTDKLRDQWIQAASQFTGIEQKGDRYAVADG